MRYVGGCLCEWVTAYSAVLFCCAACCMWLVDGWGGGWMEVYSMMSVSRLVGGWVSGWVSGLSPSV